MTDEESSSENLSSREKSDIAPIDTLSIAESLESGEEHNADPATLYIFDEHYDEGNDLDSANRQWSGHLERVFEQHQARAVREGAQQELNESGFSRNIRYHNSVLPPVEHLPLNLQAYKILGQASYKGTNGG